MDLHCTLSSVLGYPKPLEAHTCPTVRQGQCSQQQLQSLRKQAAPGQVSMPGGVLRGCRLSRAKLREGSGIQATGGGAGLVSSFSSHLPLSLLWNNHQQ